MTVIFIHLFRSAPCFLSNLLLRNKPKGGVESMKKQNALIPVVVLLVVGLMITGYTSQAQGQTSAPAAKEFKWSMQRGAASPGQKIYEVVDAFVKRVKVSSGGRLNITLHPGGGICPNTRELEAVHNGVMQIGISSCGWQLYLIPTASVFAQTVGGMDGRGMRLWFEKGDGMKLWKKATEKFNIVTLPYTPVQNFTPETWVYSKIPVTSLKSIKGKKMRAMGDGGAILNRLGLSVANIGPTEIYEALMRGVIDMTESIGPANAAESGYQEIAKYWYFSGSRANSDSGFAWVNKSEWEKLPADLQAILIAELSALGQDDYDTQFIEDMRVLPDLETKYKVKIAKLPAEIDRAILAEAEKFYAEKCAKDPFFKEVYTNQKAFQKQYERLVELNSYAK
jgi:TRAP-type mannitol/chloroaromatic compound transport system substrate-binding protein